MIDLSAKTRRQRKAAELNMAPLIDMIFILLIFFLVTTSFTRETGVTVNRPKAATAGELSRRSILVAITRTGHLYMHNRRVTLDELGALLKDELRGAPGRSVVIVADKTASTGVLIDVMDECNLAGAAKVSIASAVEGGR